MRRAILIPLVLLGTAGVLGAEPDAVATTAAAVEAAVREGATDKLAALAAKDEPDPWLVADALSARDAHDAAKAFAEADAREDVKRLAAYLAAARPQDDTKWRDAWKRVRSAPQDQAKSTLATTENIPLDPPTVTRIRLAHWRARTLHRLKQSEASHTLYSRVAAVAHKLGWLRRASTLYREAGGVAASMYSWPDATAAWDKARALLEQRGDQLSALKMRNNIGLVAQYAGDLAQARAIYEAALVDIEPLGDKQLAATILGNLGIVFELEGDLPKALSTYKRALAQKKAVGDKYGAGVTLSNIAAIHDGLGEYGKALATNRRVLALRESIGDARGVAQTHGDIGAVHHGLGDYAKALAAYDLSIEQKKALGDRAGVARSMSNRSGVFAALGERERALRSAQAALAIQEEIGDRRGAATTLMNVGVMLGASGDHEAALEAYGRARTMILASGDARYTASVTANIGGAQLALRRYDKAAATLAEALKQYDALGARADAAWALQTLGRAYLQMGRVKEGRAALERSVRLARRLRAAPLLVSALQELAKAQLDEGNAARALGTAQQGLRTLEDVLGGLGEEQGASARASFTRLFAVGALAAIEEDDLAEALTFLESGRAGALLDALGKREQLRWRAESLSEELRAADQAARAAEIAARRAYDKAFEGGQRKEIRTANRALDAASDAVRAIAGRIQRELKQQADLYYPRAETIEAIQEALAQGEALVLYGLCADQAVALVLRTDGARVARLGASDRVAAACEALDLTDPAQDPAQALAALRKQVVEPLKLSDDVTRVLISPDGPLSYVPFGALFDQRVAMTPSGTTHVLLRDIGAEKGKGVLALGAPDYNGVSEGAQAIYYRGRRLSPLPASRKEVETVGTTALIGEAASEQGLREALPKAKRWRAVHFACHGLVNVKRPMLSSLALSRSGDDDGFVTALEILRLQIPADLAVLSACETARGRIVRGEGIVGLTRAFMFAGASRVICSLWKVDDEATRALMVKFYELWSPGDGKGLSAAAALQKAQAFVRGHEAWRHPYYWAAWTLWGLPD